MKSIDKMIEHIDEEVEGAREYAEKYIECKARGHTARASKYKEMAFDELKHAEIVYAFAEEDIDNIRKVYPLSIDEEERWAHAKKKMHEHIAHIKSYLT